MEYKIFDDLTISFENYHMIEDYIRYYLFKSTRPIPYSYVLILAGIMKRRVMNAKHSAIQAFDTPHAKAILFSLMAITVHVYGQRWLLDHDHEETECVVVADLRHIFDYFMIHIRESLNKNKDMYASTVKRSLSIFTKINKSSGRYSYSNEDIQYKYCSDWTERLSGFWDKDMEQQEKIVCQILHDYDICEYLKAMGEVKLAHYQLFKIPIHELNKKYAHHQIKLE